MQGTFSRYINELTEIGGLKGTDIANIMDVSKATVSRWRTGDSKPQPRNERTLSDLNYIVGRLDEYYTRDEIRSWLIARHPQLGGERALDLVQDGRALEVLAAIDRLDSGVYV